MAINVNQALSAYGRMAKGAFDDGMKPRDEGGQSFGDMVGSALKDAVKTGHQAEALSEKAIAGKADLGEVVAAVNNAELTLQTVVAVRDRVVQAYQDILRMPI